jgi:crotonobetainyl-CoA:carnitine CoA-transferase CaiB-like acyl-CoA transferase
VVALSDVVIENNATETMEGLGITYDWLRKYRDDIIMVRIPAYGSTGPYNQARALGVHLESVMGHTLLRGYMDDDPSASTPIFSGDYLAGAQAALAVMMAVWHRNRTGEGQLVEIGQAENASAMLAQAFMEYALNGRIPERMGNRSIYGAAPTGLYPCRSVGPAQENGDRWIAISIGSDEEWRRLCGLMGHPAWAQDPAYATNAGRLAGHDDIDACLSEWTAAFEDYDLFHALQVVGIAAAPVLDGSRALEDPHCLDRDLFQPQTLFDGQGPYRFNTPFFRFSETRTSVRQPPVALGEHNDYVYRDLLGVTDAEYDRLVAAGHIAQDFDPDIP